jgi:hypothetical protein
MKIAQIALQRIPTKQIDMITIAILKATMAKLGHKFFENGDYNVNIIGIRNSATGQRVTNQFDDKMVVAYKEKDNWMISEWAITTDNGAGTARVKPGQYRGSHAIGLHQGKYEALKQCGPLTVYRDDIKDGIYNEQNTQTGIFGINIHKAGIDSALVNNWSEGCQVFKRTQDFNKFMILMKKAAAYHGNRFSYTLIDSKDLLIK